MIFNLLNYRVFSHFTFRGIIETRLVYYRFMSHTPSALYTSINVKNDPIPNTIPS